MSENTNIQKISLIRKIIFGITGTLKQLSFIVLTAIGFSMIGFVLAFPLWFLSIKTRFLFNILILIVSMIFLIFFIFNKFRTAATPDSRTKIKKIAFVLLNFIGAFFSFFAYFINISAAMYLSPCLVFLSLLINSILRKKFSFSRGFCYLIIFINFISLLYNALLFSSGPLSWFTLILVLLFIPSLGYFLFENRGLSNVINN